MTTRLFLSFLSENANYASKSKTTNKFLKFGREKKTRKTLFWVIIRVENILGKSQRGSPWKKFKRIIDV
jgi:hypothetical protein